MDRSLEDHVRLFRAIEEGDAELARALVRSNLIDAFKAVEPLIKQEIDAGTPAGRLRRPTSCVTDFARQAVAGQIEFSRMVR